MALPPLPTAESLLSRLFFQNTHEGAEIIARVLDQPVARVTAREYDDFLARLASPELSEVREELETRVTQAVEEFEKFRLDRESAKLARRKPIQEFADLSPAERATLRMIANRKLRVNPEWARPRGIEAGSIDFVGTRAGASSREVRQAFLAEEPASVFDIPANAATPAQEATGLRRLQAFLEKAQSCVQNRPPEETAKSKARYWKGGLIQSELQTAGGFLVGEKIVTADQIDWKRLKEELPNLSADMFINGLWNFTSNRLVMGKGLFMVKYVRMQAFGQFRAGVDAGYYYITPLKDTHGLPDDVASLQRLANSSGWNLKTAIIPVTTYTFLDGLECLILSQAKTPAEVKSLARKFAVGSTIYRLAQGTGTSFAFYSIRAENNAHAREKYLDRVGQEPGK